ncbi:PREDICTED: inner centromere protein A isoform X4 [Bactrocera latifrons]|uniref:inner centromere protein A isoform X4 n=1 Tax=Bactrocera latifrons TaxID=174628 RepID=UPI0008DD0A27|nr:PREDICTED: inner centromere protein A isoform X4 [Bactrocera latifrons]
MASLVGEQQISSNNQEAEPVQKVDSREGSVERKVSKDRDEKLKLARERQNEERQRKIEELKAQAEAAQRYREQKEEERRRRIEEIRQRDTEKRHQVEERKRAITEAEKERREYILRKNQERESRLETKKGPRSTVAFAFGSSTPRLLEPDFGLVSPSTYLGHRRSTSISNVTGASLSRRSSERELTDSGAKKRATSAGGTDRHEDDSVDSHATQIVFRSVARRKTDLMPTIPSPRDGHYGSRSSLSHTPRTPGRAFSMSRLDQLAQPIRRNGEHIRAILERERREQMELLDETESLGGGRRRGSKPRHGSGSSSAGAGGGSGPMSRSMTHLASGRAKYTLSSSSTGGGGSGGGGSVGVMSNSFRPLSGGQRDTTCKSLTQLNNSWSSATPRSTLGLQTAATRKYLQSSLASSPSAIGTKRSEQLLNHLTNPYRFDPNSLLIMNSSFSITTGSRSGNVTPGGNISTSRPGSAMSTSTNLSTSGYVARRSVPATRKQRPASIAGTGMSLEDLNKHKKDNRPPVKASTPSSTTTSAQNTPKRTSNLMSTSMIVSSSTRLSSAEKKTPAKRESVTPKASTPKSLSKTSSSDRLNRAGKDIMSKSLISPSPSQTLSRSEKDKTTTIERKKEDAPAPPVQSKDEKNSLNIAKSEAESSAEELTAPNESAVVIAAEAVSSEPAATTAESIEAVVPESTLIETKAQQLIDAESVDLNQASTAALPPVKLEQTAAAAQPQPQPRSQNGSKENSEVRELTPPTQNGDNNDLMTASMIARNKITTEEEAKAALAERRRLAREEAERQAELERQRLEAERLAELKRQEEEAERQRAFEEEANRLAEEQRRAEEERLRQAIEEAKQKEEEERRKREEEEKQRVQREEAEKKAKEEAEKQRIEVAERLKREEKEREERRKRVEAIMSRTRKGASGGGSATTPNSTPVKESTTPKPAADDNLPQETQQEQSLTTTTTAVTNAVSSTDSSSTSGSTTTATTPNPPQNIAAVVPTAVVTVLPTSDKVEPQNTQAMYEQAVIDKEAALINSFSNMLIDENAKNLHQQQQQQHFQQPTQILEVSNGKLPIDSDVLLQNTTTATTINTTAVSNGNGHHIENLNNKNDINNLQDAVTPATNQLIDLSIESQDINNAVNFNNNNSLLNTTTATLVTADSHDNKDISLL